MRISNDGLRCIAGFEGFVDHLYNDPAGHCTVGYGHLLHRGRCDGRAVEHPYLNGIVQTAATTLLREDAKRYEDCVNRLVTVLLNQDQFDALVSFTFNLGCGAFESSTLRRLLNQGRYDTVCDQLRRWNKAGGKVLAGLTRRREAECALFTRSGQSTPPPDHDHGKEDGHMASGEYNELKARIDALTGHVADVKRGITKRDTKLEGVQSVLADVKRVLKAHFGNKDAHS